jgi:tetratricopeptide (TPR) repeat protein
MDKLDNTLAQAHSYFAASKYDKALFLYSQVLTKEPTNKEYKLYCLFCDLAYESEEKAQGLFDYFIVAKDENFKQAVEYVQDVIKAYDGDNVKMMELLKDITYKSIESLNAIEYNDFMELVEDRGSFKEAYQDIMFSTKVAITSKEDLIDFIDKLIENNFDTTAYSYLDGFNEFFSYDNDLSELYDRLGKKNIENKTQ